VPLRRRAAPRAELMAWDGSKWEKLQLQAVGRPNLRVAIMQDGTIAEVAPAGADAVANSKNQLFTSSFLSGFNESTWDRWRNNTEKTVLPSAARTASGNSADQTNYNARGVIVFVNVTAVSGSFAAGEGLRVEIQGKDPTSGTYFTLVTATPARTTPGVETILVYPGATDVDGQIKVQNDIPLPRTWRISYTITGTNPSFTFSVGAMYIV